MTRALAIAVACTVLSACSPALRMNEIQFVGSHNSYKRAMSEQHAAALRKRNPQAAASLEYWHQTLAEQLDLGMRKLELDVFYDPQSSTLPVGHVQMIDMNSHCPELRSCLMQVKAWSETHPDHVPIWISFNAKDQQLAGLPDPAPFTAEALALIDAVVEDVLADRLVRPRDVRDRQWPALDDARGKFLLILDEGGAKRDLYLQGWPNRPLFVMVPEDHPAAAVMILNDPLADGDRIAELVSTGFLVRTRADADTREARANDVSRRDAAFASGAQAVSTDYYRPARHFDTSYVVKLPQTVRCNPINAPAWCRSVEE